MSNWKIIIHLKSGTELCAKTYENEEEAKTEYEQIIRMLPDVNSKWKGFWTYAIDVDNIEYIELMENVESLS